MNSAQTSISACEIFRLTNPSERLEWIKAFDPMRQHWVVSDLKSKQSLLQQVLTLHPALPSHCVLRASELWEKLLLEIEPRVHFIGRYAAEIFLEDWLAQAAAQDETSSQEALWLQSQKAAVTLSQHLDLFLPILSHPQGEELLGEWLREHPQSEQRLKILWQWSVKAYNHFLSQGICPRHWSAAFLSNHLRLREQKLSLIVDLGVQFSPLEWQVLKDLAFQGQVQVIVPWIGEGQDFFSLPRSYQLLLDEQGVNGASLNSLDFSSVTAVHRYATQVSEIKSSVDRIRQWLDAGVAASNIMVAVPDLQSSLSVLRLHLEKEGIAFATVDSIEQRPMAAHLPVQKWLARMRRQMGTVRLAELELLDEVINSEVESVLEFRSHWKNIYPDEEKIKSASFATNKNNLNKVLSREEWVRWAAGFIDASDKLGLAMELLAAQVVEAPVALKLPIERWFKWLEQMAARSGVDESDRGDHIRLCSFVSADLENCEYGIFLDLSEEALNKNQSLLLQQDELVAIGDDLGFFLHEPSRRTQEFELLWSLKKPWRALEFGFAETSWTGGVQTPSLLWMLAAASVKRPLSVVTPVSLSRFDEWQRQSAEKIFASSGDFNREVGQKGGGQAKLMVSTTQPSSLSTSRVENYLRCPFKYFAEKNLRLTDFAEVDLDLDHRTSGQIFHKILELALDPKGESPQGDLAVWFQKAWSQITPSTRDPHFWQAEQERAWQWFKRWFQFEQQYRQQWPKTKTIAVELDFKIFYNPQSKSFNNSQEGIAFQGYMDRVDSDGEGNYILIDYKRSTGSRRYYDSWVKNGEFQLGFYASLLERGWTKLPSGPVVSAVYFDVMDFSRHKGFVLDEIPSEFLPSANRYNKITMAQKQELFEQIEAAIVQVNERILSGEFSPEPKLPQDCPKCRWRKLCRAPHLT